jgi:hypothetical protein
MPRSRALCLDEPCGVAVDASGIYWSDAIGGAVGHATLDGTGERTLLAGSQRACGVALAGRYIYWANEPLVGPRTIGRALESGADVEGTYITGLNGPCGSAVYSHYLYFADGATIDRADLSSPDPTASTQQIVMGTRNACGVAVEIPVVCSSSSSSASGKNTSASRNASPSATSTASTRSGR